MGGVSEASTETHALDTHAAITTEQRRSCDYTFDQDILVVRGVIDFGAKLIETAERLNKWRRATVVSDDKATYGTERNNDLITIDGNAHKELAPFEWLLCQALHSCAYAYHALNRHLWVRRDTGHELLRYGPGQHFHEHVDTLSSKGSADGMRVLSCVAFMNDGFDGGELCFPRQNKAIRPEAGTVVLFPSVFTHPHASTDIVKGVKYSVASWFVN